MLKFLAKSLSPLVILALLALFPAAAAHAQTVDVKFPRGASSASIKGTLKGDQTRQYRVGVTAGQRMSVQLDTSNASNYFNITAPGASEALFIGSISGNSTSFVIPSSGNYVISVYLMRNAARRNETAKYDLTLSVEGKAGATAPRPGRPQPVTPPSNQDAISTALMPRFCAGEASAKFNIRPQDLTTNMAFKSGNNYVVQGYFDGTNGSTFFNCYFDLDGNFASVN